MLSLNYGNITIAMLCYAVLSAFWFVQLKDNTMYSLTESVMFSLLFSASNHIYIIIYLTVFIP